MITIVIVGILASVAYPSYIDYVDSSRRSEGAVALLSVASELERYYTREGEYTDDIQGTYGDDAAVADEPDNTSETGVYTITAVTNDDDTTFTLTAAPTGWNDGLCGNLILTKTGIRRVDIDQDGNGEEPEDLAVVDDCWH